MSDSAILLLQNPEMDEEVEIDKPPSSLLANPVCLTMQPNTGRGNNINHSGLQTGRCEAGQQQRFWERLGQNISTSEFSMWHCFQELEKTNLFVSVSSNGKIGQKQRGILLSQ